MTTRDEWYIPNLLYNIHYRPPKKPEPREPEVDVETIRSNPSLCIQREDGCEPHCRIERNAIEKEKEKEIAPDGKNEDHNGNVAKAALFTGWNRNDAGKGGHAYSASAVSRGCGSGGKERGAGKGEDCYFSDVETTTISSGCRSSLRERGAGTDEDGYAGDNEATPVSSGCSISLKERFAIIGEECYVGDDEATATTSIGCSGKDRATGIGEDGNCIGSDDTDSIDIEEQDDDEISSAFGIMSVYCNSELHGCTGQGTKKKAVRNRGRSIELLLQLTKKIII